MGSGNTSGSFQSSSGGDDLHIPSSAAAAGTSTTHFGHVSATNQNQTLHNLPSTILFDPSTSYLSSLPHSNFIPHRRSTADLGNFPGGPSSVSDFGNQDPFMPNGTAKLLTSPSSEHQGPLNTLGVRNSKKRTRASRRAPTTVLTTDTSNFRAMVQEFTGIPAPPFAGPSYSRRLDLLRSGQLRPSSQKIQPLNPFLASDSSTPSLLLDNVADTGPAGNYLNMHNPILSFQSFLQPPTRQQQDQVNVSSGGGWRSRVGSTQLRASADQGSFNISATNHSPAPRSDATVDSWICPSD